MKSLASAIAASILTAFACAPASRAMPISETRATTLSEPSAQIARMHKTPLVLAQLSAEPGYGAGDAADNQNDAGDSADADSSTQTDDQGNGDDAQNGDADNGDTDQNAQSADHADNDDKAKADDGEAGNAQSDSGDADQSGDSSTRR